MFESDELSSLRWDAQRDCVEIASNEVNVSSVAGEVSRLVDRDADVCGGKGWRDTQLEIRGPVTYQLEGLFRDTWMRHGGRAYPPYAEQSTVPEGLPLVLAGALTSDERGDR